MNFLATDQPWLLFRHPLVRELAFCIASPPLLAHWPASLAFNANQFISAQDIVLPDSQFWQQQFVNYLPRLQQLDTHPQQLEQHLLSLHSRRLGIRFEHLLAFWLHDNTYHPFTLLGQGIKRMDGQRTVGEIDFLILNQDTQKIEHWEVAIKFYLGEGHLNPEHWLGANRRDSLDRKLNHVCLHQFNVTHTDEHAIDLRRAIIKGRLYYPAGKPVHYPNWATPQHLTGFWGYTVPPAPKGFTWRYASRQEWMVAIPDFMPINSPTDLGNETHPVYWRNGLYLLLDTENKVVLHYMLRIIHKSPQSINLDNTLKPNLNAVDIFNQISII
ncbi:MAG: DUF1853 family protein [Moraxellaceae bacterium]|nr:MAG: DUF1853 family protein [Moraxellaceae bacterium]